MILPINISEYTDKIARNYDNLPEGQEKEELWKEIERIAEKLIQPSKSKNSMIKKILNNG
jgi:hypothetical protein